MTARSAESRNKKKIYLLSLVLVIFTYLADSTVDAILEHENLAEQLLSPPRLVLLGVVMAAVAYVISLGIRNSTLKKSHSLQLAAMESSIDGIAIFADNRLLYTNKAHTRLFGYDSQDELLNRDCLSFYPEEEQERFREHVMPSLKKAGQWQGEAIGIRKDGGRFPLELSLTGLENGGMVRVARDISEKKNYQNELERKARELLETNRELETFSYSLSHDMRSYITRVSSAAQLLQEGDVQELNDTGRYIVESIHNTAEDMEHLVESIQVLASISRCRPHLEQVDLSGTVGEIAAGLALSEPERQVKFLIQPGLVTACDKKLAKVALYNLLQNAWKYTGSVPSPRIEFGSEEHDGREFFFIRDNGVGFDMKDANRLFEPFRRLDNARDYPGTGIGLATVQRVIQLHKGEIRGIGTPGTGATFYFRFC